MSESNQLDRTFQIILKHLMETGKAPHNTEIAAGFINLDYDFLSVLPPGHRPYRPEAENSAVNYYEKFLIV